MEIAPGCTVTLHYTLNDSDGELLEQTPAQQPRVAVIGAGDLLAGLERSLLGMRAGETRSIRLDPDAAYGPRERGRLVRLPRSSLHGVEPAVGTILRRLSTDGRSETYRVTGFLDQWIYADGNHPYAGRTLVYRVRVVAVS